MAPFQSGPSWGTLQSGPLHTLYIKAISHSEAGFCGRHTYLHPPSHGTVLPSIVPIAPSSLVFLMASSSPVLPMVTYNPPVQYLVAPSSPYTYTQGNYSFRSWQRQTYHSPSSPVSPCGPSSSFLLPAIVPAPPCRNNTLSTTLIHSLYYYSWPLTPCHNFGMTPPFSF